MNNFKISRFSKIAERYCLRRSLNISRISNKKIGYKRRNSTNFIYGGPQRQHDFLFKVQNISFLAALFFVLKLFFDFARCSGFLSRKIYFQAFFFFKGIFFSVAKFIFERNFFYKEIFFSPNKLFLL